MKVQIEINDEIFDSLMAEALLDSIDSCYCAAVELLDRKNLEDYQKVDLSDDLRDLVHLKATYKYYTVHSDWYNLDKYSL